MNTFAAPPSELQRPATLNLTCGSALAILVDARPSQELDDDVHERNRIPHQIDRCPLGPVERIPRLSIEVTDVDHAIVTTVVKTRDHACS